MNWSMVRWELSVVAGVLAIIAAVHLPLVFDRHQELPPHELDWTTPAEAADFQATPSYAETLAYLDQLAEFSPAMELQSFGTTARGRELIVAVISGDRAFTPGEARVAGKPVVLLINGIHPGEICGKDAMLILLRELLVEERFPSVLDEVVLLVVPVFNVDGHERADHRQSRANQDGPVDGMGFRTTATGMDLNRDFMKLETVEMQALIGGLVQRWDPHLVVDSHTTDGADHQYPLSYGMDLGPRVDPGVAAWTEQTVARVAVEMERARKPVAPYVFLRDWMDPASGMAGGWGTTRFSTSYFALRDRASILTEAHSFKPYRVRVEATHHFIAFLLLDVAGRPSALTGAVRAADVATESLAAGAGGPAGAVPLRVERTETPRPFLYRTHEYSIYEGLVSGGPVIRYSDVPVTMEVELYDQMAVTLEVDAPAGYLIPPEYPQLAQKLALHGFVLETLPEPTTVEVEMVRLHEVSFDDEPYQGRQRADAVSWEMERGPRTFPAGSYWLPLDQPGAKVAVHLLEPMAPDSFFSWGYLSRSMESKEWFSTFVMEPMAAEMLDADPALLAEFNARLVDDEAFRGDPRARLDFFYRRTEHADPDWRLLPIARVPAARAAGLQPYQLVPSSAQ